MSLAAFNAAVLKNGSALNNATIEVRSEDTGQLVPVYADRNGLTPLGNPFVWADGSHLLFYVEGGSYQILAISGSDQVQWDDEAIGTAGQLDKEDVLFGKRVQVRVAATGNVTIATGLNNGDVLEGVTLATNDLVLLPAQSTPSQNGFYVVGVSPARHADFDSFDEHVGALAFVKEGTTNANTAWACAANAGGVLGTDAINFTKINQNPLASAAAVREVTAAGTVTITAVDEVVAINKTTGAATTVSLPAAATILNQPNRTNFLVVIKDRKGDAESNNITINASGGETFDGAAGPLVISSNGGAIALRPVTGGWIIT